MIAALKLGKGLIIHLLFYDLDQDPSEQYPLDENEYADIFTKLTQMKDEYNADMTWAESETSKPQDPALEPCCNPGCTPHPNCCACAGHGGEGTKPVV